MPVTVTCANGHVLHIKEKYGGKTGRCPKCNIAVHVPAIITDDDVLNLVGAPSPPPAPAPPPEDEYALEEPLTTHGTSGVSLLGTSTIYPRTKTCPRCFEIVLATFTACPHCHTYLA